MTWDESEHPRDDIGRFTFKGGSKEEENEKENKKEERRENKKDKYKTPDIDGVFRLGAEINVKPKNSSSRIIYTGQNSTEKPKTIKKIKKETSAQILYKNSRIAKEIEIANRKSKNELLNILGDKATNSDILYGNKETLEKKIEDLGIKNENTSTAANLSEKWDKPVNYIRISSPYGPRIHPIKKTNIHHNGIDLAVPQGSEIKSPANGTVEHAGPMGQYGYLIIINHGKINGKEIKTKYAHLSKFNVKKGDTVAKNSTIGLTGGKKGDIGAGASTGPHLHLELLIDGKHTNPEKLIKF